MTPEEAVEVSSIGLALSMDVAANIVLFSVLFGLYSLAYYISIYIYFKTKGDAGNAKHAMICVLLGNYVLMLIFCVSSVASTPETVQHDLILTLPGGIMEQIVAANSRSQITVYQNLLTWLSNLIPLIADAVIMWRAWAVWMDNRKVKGTLLLFMLADIDTTATTAQQNDTAFRAWLHYKSMNSISIRRKKTQSERILLLLVESGAIYIIVQLLMITTLALSTNASGTSTISFVVSLIGQFYVSAASLNPVLIFILVQTQNTYDQSFHLEDISTPSQQAQLQQVSVILHNLEGTPAEVGLADQGTSPTNMDGST
ncbi:hypothetical protein BDP27DRAFT_1357833 [Rhodocollybia butyracea]|uniref:Uncharacterized protein n=1 Tax=Rhodocollybia butyracea TaxID=206335 RepID=A0A9P5Q8S4_9AGAR|nr:hypothetical protein BDP27DRAFT_1357833 [Rhodocollybia butyracea]